MKHTESLLGVLVACSLLAACSSTPVNESPAASRPAATTGSPGPTSPAAHPSATPSSTVTTVVLPHKDPKSAISTQRSVYFDFDDFAVKTEFHSVIERHGKYLQTNPVLAIRLEGHADERGSAEYNLSLGQKRAEAVQRALKLYGVKESQMEAVSFGEERPRATEGAESAWAQNRRADIAYRN